MAMKNRKRIIAAFLLVACLLVGVGYAAVTDTFVLNGNATVSEQGATDALNEQIVFAAIVLDGPGGTDEVTSAALTQTGNMYTAAYNVPQDSATFHVYGLKQKDDSETITYRIKNEGDVAAVIRFAAGATATNSNETYFDVSYTTGTNADNSLNTAVDGLGTDHTVDLAAGATIDVTVTVTLKATPKEEITGAFTFTFTAERPD